MEAVVVDTDVVSYVFKQDTRARSYHRHLVGRHGLLSFMTLAELDRWAIQQHWGQSRRDHLARFLLELSVIHSNRELCRVWAQITDKADQLGRPLDCADAWIVVAALLERVPLVTNNPRGYSSVLGLTVLSSRVP